MSDAACNSPGLRVWSYQAIHSLCLPLLNLDEHGRGQAVYQDQLPLALSWRLGQQSLKAPPTTGCLLGSVTRRASGSIQVVWHRFSMSPSVRASVVHQIDTDSNLLTMMGLRPLRKILGSTKASYHLPGPMDFCGEVIRLGPVGFIRLKQTKI